MNRLDATFAALKEEGKKAFVAYVVAGDPDMESSLEILKAISEAGADVIELGLPFSDPLADGIVNQMAAERSLAAGGSTKSCLELVRRFRETHQTPIVFFTYLNPVYNYGFSRFQVDAKEAGLDGILLLDLPPDEAAHTEELAEKTSDLHRIQLIAPNTPEERVEMLCKHVEGFVYALSRAGVTGAHGAPAQSVGETVARVKAYTDVPVCVGFGISTPERASAVAEVADGVVVGSAIVKLVEKHAGEPDVAQKVGDFVKTLVAAIR